jgi:hypothetical protein
MNRRAFLRRAGSLGALLALLATGAGCTRRPTGSPWPAGTAPDANGLLLPSGLAHRFGALVRGRGRASSLPRPPARTMAWT